MGRRGSYKAFVPSTPPPGFSRSANGHKKWTKPVKTTISVDKAKGRVKKEISAGAAATDHFIGVDTTSQAITITLPKTSDVGVGKIFLLKDEGGNAGTNSVTIATADSATIDGSSTIQLDSDYAAISIYYNGTEWSVY